MEETRDSVPEKGKGKGKDALGEVLRLIPETRGELLPSGAVRLPDGGIVCAPVGTSRGVMDPSPKGRGELIPTDGRSQLTPTGGGRSAQHPAPSVRDTAPQRKRRAKTPPALATELLGIRLDRGVFPSQYRYVLRGNGVMVLGMCQGSFRPDEPTDTPTEVEVEPDGVYHYFGHRVTDRDGGEAIVLLRIGRDDL